LEFGPRFKKIPQACSILCSLLLTKQKICLLLLPTPVYITNIGVVAEQQRSANRPYSKVNKSTKAKVAVMFSLAV
jgi:hypothetical protein